jgi:hypothetical protein
LIHVGIVAMQTPRPAAAATTSARRCTISSSWSQVPCPRTSVRGGTLPNSDRRGSMSTTLPDGLR